ncbi:rCG37900 [Rattus norvegicus]|uniref:RCG37900 n=1 Tax=Rattus norvegicus TaxID=10116 RepID=A6K5X1_RAT|nr:rCG37900 [Rattus norvegicus]
MCTCPPQRQVVIDVSINATTVLPGTCIMKLSPFAQIWRSFLTEDVWGTACDSVK